MNILGIDYGKSKVGLALSRGKLSEPLRVIKYKDENNLIQEIQKIIIQEKIEKIVVGISEGEMAEESKKFSLDLKNALDVSVVNQDETLSTRDAINLSIQGGIGRKKRKEMEDAYAASIMLQNYIDSFSH